MSPEYFATFAGNRKGEQIFHKFFTQHRAIVWVPDPVIQVWLILIS